MIRRYVGLSVVATVGGILGVILVDWWNSTKPYGWDRVGEVDRDEWASCPDYLDYVDARWR